MRERARASTSLAPSNADFGEVVTVRQQQPLGLGHAVWCARDIIGDEPFAVLLPDDLMAGTPGALKQMVDAWEKVGGKLRRDRGSAGGKDRATASSTLARQTARSPKFAASSKNPNLPKPRRACASSVATSFSPR